MPRQAPPLPVRPGPAPAASRGMAVFHDEVEIEDFEYDEETGTYSYPCPCGDRFLITRVRGGRAGLWGRTGWCGPWAGQAAGP